MKARAIFCHCLKSVSMYQLLTPIPANEINEDTKFMGLITIVEVLTVYQIRASSTSKDGGKQEVYDYLVGLGIDFTVDIELTVVISEQYDEVPKRIMTVDEYRHYWETYALKRVEILINNATKRPSLLA